MSILLKRCSIYDSRSKYHKKKMDLLIDKGQIVSISKNISEDNHKVITGQNLCISPSWVDVGTYTGEPGNEHKETLKQTLDAAARGGYGRICIMPETGETIDSASRISYINEKSSSHIVKCNVIGALSKKLEGKDLTEMLDMSERGAIAFTDGLHSIDDSGLLSRALQYAKQFDGLIIHYPGNKNFSPYGQVNEGKMSTSLGLSGMPAIAEAVMIERDLQVREYIGGKILLHLISSKEGLSKIQKQSSEKVYSSVSYHNLIETDETLLTFDVNRKVMPPLRTKADVQALNRGVKSGQIDIICSNHIPLDQESKHKEFLYADFGAIGLQTCGLSILENFGNEIASEKLAIAPRKVFGWDADLIEKGNQASLTLWDDKREYTFNKADNQSKAVNSPFFGTSFSSTILGIIDGNRLSIHNS